MHHMGFSLPLGILLKKPIEWAAQKLFLNAYQASDEYYWQLNKIGASWKNIGNDIEYDTYLATIFSNGLPPLSYIAIRSSSSLYKKITLKLEAEGPFATYQEIIIIHNLNEKPVIKALPSIPLKSMWVARGGIMIPYGRVHIEVIEQINNKNQDVLEGKKIEDYFNPSYTEILNSEFVKRWGYYWNVDEINWQKQYMKDYFYMMLIFSAGHPWKSLNSFNPRFILFKILTNKLSLSIAFWSKNLIYGKQIRDSIKKQKEDI